MAQVTQETVVTWNQFKSGKISAGYLNIKIDNAKIHITELGEKYSDYKEFVQNAFKKDEAQYVAYHFAYTNQENAKRVKSVIFQWIPTACSPKEKMQYAMNATKVKHSLEGVHCFVQACSAEDLEFENVLAHVSRFDK